MSPATVAPATQTAQPARDTWQAIKRGFVGPAGSMVGEALRFQSAESIIFAANEP